MLTKETETLSGIVGHVTVTLVLGQRVKIPIDTVAGVPALSNVTVKVPLGAAVILEQGAVMSLQAINTRAVKAKIIKLS